ncbi:MAG: NAD(P)-dependent oxidoreductase [Phycisphaerales bacterium]|nr:NAD(P)-dependent oxidoreductase [Phycisphaerales bacterium]
MIQYDHRPYEEGADDPPITNLPSMEGRSIALIGGAGFIGHHLAIALRRCGAEVTVIDSLQVNHLLAFATPVAGRERSPYVNYLLERLDLLERWGVRVMVQDARDYHALCHALGEIRPNVIVHLAAVAHADQSNKNPYSTFDHSLRTLENALDNARSSPLNVERFVYFSSSMVYGAFTNPEMTEDAICDPLGIYGALKFAGEKLVIAYHQVFNLPYTIIRPSALYGERCVSRRVAQMFAESALRGEEIMVRGDGAERLDFTYIDDLTQGVIRAIDSPNARNEIFNITYGAGRSLEELVSVLRERVPGVNVRYLDRDRLSPRRGTLSIDKARRLIGYEPQFPIERGYARYIDWCATRLECELSSGEKANAEPLVSAR